CPISLIISLSPRAPSPTPFPYTTLFRSRLRASSAGGARSQAVCESLPRGVEAGSSVVRRRHADRRTDSTRPRARRQHHPPSPPRSEEHTSELQSPCNLVCRLLLEKKKKK